MSRLLSILVLAMFLLSIIPSIPLVYAATRTIDGDPTDWTGTPPATDNTGDYDTTAGEWIWRDVVKDERSIFSNIYIDGADWDWNNNPRYHVATDTNIANDQAGANVSDLYVAWNSTHLLILLKTGNTDSWSIDYGIAIDTGSGGYTTGTDAYGKNIQFGGGYAPDFEIYVKVREDVSGNNYIEGVTLHNWTGSSWQWIKDLTSGSEYKEYIDASGNFIFIEIAVKWGDMGLTNIPSTISIIAFAAGTAAGDSAVDSVPDDPTVVDNVGGEWNDVDTFTQLADVNLNDINNIARDPAVDLTELRVTGDTTYFYVLIKLNNTSYLKLGDNGAPFIALTIDRDRVNGSGQIYFAGNSDTTTDNNAAWEYQLVIDLADSRYSGKGLTSTTHPLNESTNNWGAIFQLLDNGWNHVFVSGDDGTNGLLAVDLSTGVIEVKIDWDLIGGIPNDQYIRFELLVGRGSSNYGGNSGETWDISGSSDALDCTTTASSTEDEVEDGTINYYVDVYFVNGEPTPPPPPSYKVYGYVFDQYGNPVAGATVDLNGTTNTTDVNGYYEVYVSSGTYIMTVTKPGYDKFTSKITVTTDKEINVTLWKFLVDTTTNTNDFPAGSLVYQAEQLLSATGNSENALSRLYVAWDEKYLYVGADFSPGTSKLAYGIGIDANPSTTIGYNNGTDSWGRSLNFTYAYIDYEFYVWYDGSSITSIDFNKYEAGTWIYDYMDAYYGPVATTHDGSTVFKVAIPWVAMNVTGYNGTIVLVAWITGSGGSAVSSLPLNPETLTAGTGEWSDADNIYMYVSITVDQDIDGAPDTGVSADTRTVFYPRLNTTLTTDHNVYNVVTGGTVNVIATLTDILSEPLPSVYVYINDSSGTTVASGYTDASGQVTLSFTAPATPGSYSYIVAFDGHAGWRSSTKTITVVTSAPSYKVYGYVTDKDTGSGIVNAKVELLDPDTLNPVVTNNTIANGYYELYTSPGTYILRVNKSDAGYAVYTVKVTVTGDTRVDVELMKYLIDLTTNTNDFPLDSFIYTAKDYLTAPRPANHNLSRVYIAWDTEYLYIGTDFAPGDWWVAFGIGIDVNPGNSTTGYGAVWATDDNAWEDCWRRKINFTTPYSVGPIYPELITYIWYQGTDGITAAEINRYKYEAYPPVVDPTYGVNHNEPWEYGYATPKYSPVATTKDYSTLFKVAIPWTAIQYLPGIEYTGEIALVIWVSHGDTSSALSVLPNNPLVFDQQSWSEWGDVDVLYMGIKITYDSDKDYVPDDVAPNTVSTFYPEIPTSVETDKDVYEVGAGVTFNILAKVKDSVGNYLSAVRVEVYDHTDAYVTSNLTNYNTGDTYAFTAVLTITAPLTKGVYNYKVRFVGEAGFNVSEKVIVINVTKSGTRITDLTATLTLDYDGDGVPDSGDIVTVSFKLEGYDGGWHGLDNRTVQIIFNYTLHGIVETVNTTTDSYGYVSYDYTIASIAGADKLVITVVFSGDENYTSAIASKVIEINLARVIDGLRGDWGTDYPRSTPGIAPRGDEIVITDPLRDVHQAATDEYTELDIKEVRITYDGLYLYFYVKFNGSLTRSDEFTVDIAVDATPDNPGDGVGGGWLYGYWYTDMRLGGFDATGAHVDTWQWTHIIEAVPIEGTIQVRALSEAVKNVGDLAVDTTNGFIEFRVPITELSGLDPLYGFRVWIVVFGVPSRGQYLSLVGANAIDVAGVGDTNFELLTSRDPNWANLTWPSEDIWVDTAFFIKFSAPSTPDIPDPSPTTPPEDVAILYIVYNGTLYKAEEFKYDAHTGIKVLFIVKVTGTQGRPVTVKVGDRTFTGVAGADDTALITGTLPGLVNGYIDITATSDGASSTISVRAIFPPPLPEPPILPLILLIIILILLLIKKKK